MRHANGSLKLLKNMAQSLPKTCLSAGEIIHYILTHDDEVMRRTRKVFPVAAFDAVLPYIVYSRTQLEQTPHTGTRPADMAAIEVLCFTEQYTDGVELAEAVRAALDGVQAEVDGARMRSCYLADSEEAWADDAFVQRLIFNVKI